MNKLEQAKYDFEREMKEEYREKYFKLKEVIYEIVHNSTLATEKVATIKKVIELIDELEAQ